jgi:hypothetical protein
VTISWENKMREAKRIASLALPGRATDLAVVLLSYLNPEIGVAWPSVEELADDIRASTDTVWRAAAALDRAEVARFAKRRGAAARWFPQLLDMTPEEAKRRVSVAVQEWRASRAVGGDTAKMRSLETAVISRDLRDLKPLSKDQNVIAGGGDDGGGATTSVTWTLDESGATALFNELRDVLGIELRLTQPFNHPEQCGEHRKDILWTHRWLERLQPVFRGYPHMDARTFMLLVARDVKAKLRPETTVRTVRYLDAVLARHYEEFRNPRPLPETG